MGMKTETQLEGYALEESRLCSGLNHCLLGSSTGLTCRNLLSGAPSGWMWVTEEGAQRCAFSWFVWVKVGLHTGAHTWGKGGK